MPLFGFPKTIMATSQQVQALYIAYFGRPADPDGLAHWTQVGDLESLADQMANSREYIASIAGKDPREVINSFYVNLFGRNGEQTGVNTWLAAVLDGDTTLQDVGLYIGRAALTNPAANADTAALVAKTIAADKFTVDLSRSPESLDAYGTSSGIEAGRQFLASVTGVSSIPSDAQITSEVSGLTGGGSVATPSAVSNAYALSVEADLAGGDGTTLRDLTFATGAVVGFPAFAFTNANQVVTGIASDTVTDPTGATVPTVNDEDFLVDISATDQDVLNIDDATGSVQNLIAANIENINFRNINIGGAGGALIDNSDVANGITATGVQTITAAGTTAGAFLVDAAGTGASTINLSGVSGAGSSVVVADAVASNITGSASNDNITGSALGDDIDGGADADILDGGDGDDRLAAGLGNDQMTGGGGSDTFVSDIGVNTITDFGTGGNDDIVNSAGATATITVLAANTVTNASSNAGTINAATTNGTQLALSTAISFANLTGTSGVNLSAATQTANGVILTGSAQNDVITGGGGGDLMNGGNGADTIIGGAFGDTMTGGLGNDIFVGSFAGTSVVAAALAVQAGNNWAANDKFTFANAIVDRIVDFETGTNVIRKAAGNAANIAAITNLAGQARTTALNDADGAYVLYGNFNATNGEFTVAADFDAVNSPDALFAFGQDGQTLTGVNSTSWTVVQDLANALVVTDAQQA